MKVNHRKPGASAQLRASHDATVARNVELARALQRIADMANLPSDARKVCLDALKPPRAK